MCGNAFGGYINLSPLASGALALDNTFAGGDTTTSADFPGGEAPELALDGNLATKYLIFSGSSGDGTAENSGIMIFFDEPVVAKGLLFGFANDAPERDPWTYTLEGSNAVTIDTYGTPPSTIADGPAWEAIQTDPTSVTGMVDVSDTFFDVFDARETYTDEAPFFRNATPFDNDQAYSAYRLLFPTLRIDQGIMQVAEIELLGVPEPTAISLLGACLLGVLAFRRK